MNDLRRLTSGDRLSEREVQILQLLAEGLSNRQIAQKLTLSLETIKWYNRQLYSKLGVSSRAQAAAYAREAQLLAEAQGVQDQTGPALAHNLPAQWTSFVGRERQIAEITDVLARTRLVTLTGAGGSGKTRLALRVAATVAASYRDGVLFVPLASISRPSLVANAMAHAIGLTEATNRPLPEVLQAFFQARQALLLLDNFEHVLEAAPLVSQLLASAPALVILTTSREPLRLTGEHEYQVPPLTLPLPDTPATHRHDSEAVSLFVQRAQTIDARFSLTEENAPAIASICRRLDGLPLALELAAARIKLFGPRQLLERLESRLDLLTRGPRDLPARQRTLRATIDWSYDLLDQAEQRLLARLSVFHNGRSLEAVEVVCGPGLGREPLGALESLLNKNMVFQAEGPGDSPRFFMLETIREYALERLADSGEAESLRDRHLAYFLGLGEAMEPGFRWHHQLLFLEHTDAEMGNFRAAYEWAMRTDQIEAAARLVSAIDYYFRYRDGTVEGYQWMQRLTERIEEVSPARRIRFLIAAARLAWQRGNVEEARSFSRWGLALARSEGNRHAEAWSLVELGISVLKESANPQAYAEAIGQHEEAIALFRAFDDKPGLAYALNAFGLVLRANGEHERARHVTETALAICYETGEVGRQSTLLSSLAYAAYLEGDYEQAREMAFTSLKQHEALGLRLWFFIGLAGLAGPLSKLGQPQKAACLLGASAAMLETMGLPYPPSDRDEVALYVADVRAQLDDETFAAAWAQGRAMTMGEAVALVMEKS